MLSSKTPGVYINEENSFGNGIVANSTAIPAFIGFTEKSEASTNETLKLVASSTTVRVPMLIESVLEYESFFGGADQTGIISLVHQVDPTQSFGVKNLKDSGGVVSNYVPGWIYPSVSNYFANGGGSCYIISLGSYDQFDASDPSTVDIEGILSAIQQANTSTLIVPIDLERYGKENYYKWASQFTDFCGTNKKRFCVLDVIQSDPTSSILNEADITDYRHGVNSSAPSYAATYYPYLKSLATYSYDSSFKNVQLNGFPIASGTMNFDVYTGLGLSNSSTLFRFSYTALTVNGASETPKIVVSPNAITNDIVAVENVLTISAKSDVSADEMNQLWNSKMDNFPNWCMDFLGDLQTYSNYESSLTNHYTVTLDALKSYLSTNYINMPASPFMVGIYSRLDNMSGVWTPPANVSPSGISGPVVPITSEQQEGLNIDAVAGKSINAIRSFTGRGTLVWGARTNDGNSTDWRYINVRRLCISMETDISKALESYVFQPNVHNTWVEVKTAIESYLFGLFNQGALAGTTPTTSYQVLIGLGETMTNEDVLNGVMRVSVMFAPVRPAEFILLMFSQQVGQ